MFKSTSFIILAFTIVFVLKIHRATELLMKEVTSQLEALNLNDEEWIYEQYHNTEGNTQKVTRIRRKRKR